MQHEKCTELLAAGFIEKAPPNSYLYASNCVVPSKKDADGNHTERRFTVDLRAINEACETQVYNPPTPEHIFGMIDGAQFISRFDLRQSFHQIPLAEVDRCKLSFWWGRDLYRYKVMPMGHKNSSQKMQSVVDAEIHKYGWVQSVNAQGQHTEGNRRLEECTKAYLDDLICFSPTAEQHIIDVAAMLKMLHQCGLRAHPQKTLVCADVLEFIGHNVGPYGLSPSEAKVAAIKAIPHPTNVKELQSVLGFFNYYRSYVPMYSALAFPLNRLLAKGVPFVWGPAEAKALNKIRDEMCM